MVVQRLNADDGLYDLRLPEAAADVSDWADLNEGMLVEAQVTGHNTGGLECEVNHIRGFIPISQVAIYRVEDLAQFVGQRMTCLITEANPMRRNLVLSRRDVLEREKEEARQKLLDSLQPGQVHEGVVRKLMDFGAFVDIGGVDGLVHVSQLAWNRVSHPREVLAEGQKIQVKIEKIDRTTGKIGLSYRDLLENPWTGAAGKYPPNSVVHGKVTKLMEFGAFVELEPGVEGLVHISELSHKRVWRASDVVHAGDEIERHGPFRQPRGPADQPLPARPLQAGTDQEREGGGRGRAVGLAPRVEAKTTQRPTPSRRIGQSGRRRALRPELVTAYRGTVPLGNSVGSWHAAEMCRKRDFFLHGGLRIAAAFHLYLIAAVTSRTLSRQQERKNEMRLLAVTCPCVLLATLIWAAGSPAPGQMKLETVSPTDPRRTPVVEVFHRWKDSVVYLTGPIATTPGPSIEEFFSVPSAHRQMISIGSGFVVHESGFVVTNAHAVEWVIAHHATLADGRTYPAELVGLSPEYDLALLKISAGRPLHAVQLGKSGDFILGETIIVISNPAGLMHTCTSGIISAANRETTPNALPGVILHGLIQTDASINMGSSGGPWFNVLGDVIGVTTALKAGSTNIGFGIPVSAVRHTLPDMLDVERLYGIYTGVNTQALPQEPCAVANVAARSPAAAAGIQNRRRRQARQRPDDPRPL